MKKTITRLAIFFAVVFSSYSAFGQNYVDFGLYPDTYCSPAQLTVYNNSSITVYTGVPQYKWFVDGTQVSTLFAPTGTFLVTEGIHIVKLEVYDDNSLLGSATYSVEIYGKITEFMVSTGATVCPGQEITFSLAPNVSYYTTEWDFDYPGYFSSPISSTNPSYFVYDKPGTYNVRLSVSHYCGTDTLYKSITVSNTAKPALLASDIIVEAGCINDPVKFKTTGQFASLIWDFGDGQTSTLTEPVHTYKTSVSADYTAKLTVTNQCGGNTFVNFPVSIKDSVPANADFNFSVLGGQPNCVGAHVIFEPLGQGTYSWDFGDGTSSTEKNPAHRFSQAFYHNVALSVTNGCLNSNTVTKEVYVNDYDESYVPYPDFNFNISSNYGYMQTDTLHLCPGQTANFINQSTPSKELTYSWDFGDGTTLRSYNASHLYSTSGLYPITLVASNVCGTANSAIKYVLVDAGNTPSPNLKAVPTTICAGDKVYFLDDNFDTRLEYTYSLNFGDGNSVNNLKSLSDLKIKTLVSHAYLSGGPYNYTFTATNVCGNSVSSKGTITIDNSITRKPFYYVENSTENRNAISPKDWSARKSPSDYEVIVNIIWPSWLPTYGNVIYLNMWYGGATLNEMNPKYPDGFVRITAANLAAVTEVKAYIPVDATKAMSVGFKAAFYCDGVPRYGDMPEAIGALTNGNLLIQSIPIVPSGSIVLSDSSKYISIDSYWDGMCASEKIEGRWARMIEPGVFAILNLWDSGDGLTYDMSYQDAVINYTKSNDFGNGYYYRISNDGNTFNDTVDFYSSASTCYYDGYYHLNRLDANTIQFTGYDERCPVRTPFLNGTFTRIIENPNAQNAVCPGDKVEFKAVGGVSYAWNFGDGATSTQQYPLHAYATPGSYNARVIGTNSCGRKDTINTLVTVMAKPAPHTFFFFSENETFVGDSVHFKYEMFNPDFYDTKTYSWNFGDGSSSTLKNPAHVFKKLGDYTVTLSTTSGCGTSSNSQLLTISSKLPDCEARFSYWFDGTTGFDDLSIGNPTSWSWDFGNGTYSTEQYPASFNYDKEGVYNVTLTIYNDITNCVSSVTQKVVAGWSLCQADFKALINTNSGVTNFISNSQRATDYYWDFGDGDYSIDPNPTHTYTKTGIYSVCLTIWDSNNSCQSVVCKDVMFIPSNGNYILSGFDYYIDNTDNTVSFYDLSSTVTTDWYWTLGDGKITKEQNPVYTYAKPGVYKVCLTVFDKQTSLSQSVCKKVRVGEPICNVGSDFSYFVVPGDLKVSFISKAKGTVDKYFWSFGDGGSAFEENPSYYYNVPGYYNVTLSVRNSTNGCIDQYSQYVQVGTANCKADFNSRINPDNNSVEFKDNSRGKIDYYYWNFGDGNYSVAQNPDNSYSKAGLYLVSQTVINDMGTCMDVDAQFVQVGDINCAADFKTYVDASTSTAYFTHRALGEYTFLFWSFGDGSYSTEENPVHEFPGSGIYSAGLNTYDMNNGCMDFYQEKLLIGEIGIDCQADFVYRVDPANSDVTFSNKSTGDIVESLWNFGDETENSIEAEPVHHFAKPGYYNVCLNVINSEGIKNIGCKWVMVQANASNDCKADFMFSIDATTKKVNFVDNSYGNIDKYTWDFGDSRNDSISYLKNPSHTYNQKGYYTAKLRVENTSTGCVSKEFKLLNVGELQVLKASFGYEALGENKKVAGYPVDLVSASSGDGATVEWDFGDKQIKKGTFTVMDSTSLRPTHYYQLPGKYIVCLRISDPVSGQSDTYCSLVSTKYGVGVEEEFETNLNLSVYPNPFTDFTTINYSLAQSEFVEISVFDQLGRKIETLVKSRKESGNFQIIWETQSVTSGVYHLKMITTEGTFTKQLVLTR